MSNLEVHPPTSTAMTSCLLFNATISFSRIAIRSNAIVKDVANESNVYEGAAGEEDGIVDAEADEVERA